MHLNLFCICYWMVVQCVESLSVSSLLKVPLNLLNWQWLWSGGYWIVIHCFSNGYWIVVVHWRLLNGCLALLSNGYWMVVQWRVLSGFFFFFFIVIQYLLNGCSSANSLNHKQRSWLFCIVIRDIAIFLGVRPYKLRLYMPLSAINMNHVVEAHNHLRMDAISWVHALSIVMPFSCTVHNH